MSDVGSLHVPPQQDGSSGIVVQDDNVEEGTGITTVDFGAGLDVAVTGAEAVITIGAVTVTTQAADYTLALADANTQVEGTKATAQAITVPPNADVAFPVGTQILITQMGAGQITVTAGAGVTLRAPGGAKTRVQYSQVSVYKRATNEWVVGGDSTT